MKCLLFAATIFSACFFSSCTNQSGEETKINFTQKSNGTAPMESSDSMSLKTQLDKKKRDFEAKADEQTKTIYKAGIDAISNSGLLANAKQVGDAAPNFELQNAVGENISLAEILKEGPVILTWYRGGWCPYCNLTLQKLQEELPNFTAENATLIALTPELPDSSISTKEKHQLTFQILSDVGNKVAKKYGVVFTLTPDVAKRYQEKFNLAKYNGDSTNQLPLAATYIINQQGKIVYAFLDADYRNRAEPAALTAILRQMGK